MSLGLVMCIGPLIGDPGVGSLENAHGFAAVVTAFLFAGHVTLGNAQTTTRPTYRSSSAWERDSYRGELQKMAQHMRRGAERRAPLVLKSLGICLPHLARDQLPDMPC